MAVTDSALNLLSADNATGVAKATSVSLTGAANVSAAQATTLAAMTGFARATGATLQVSDNAANLLASGNATGIAKATSVSLIGTNSVTAEQATALTRLSGFALASSAQMNVADTAANLLDIANAAGVARASAVSLIGSNGVTAAQATSLTGLTGLTLATGATLEISDTAANLLASGAAAGLARATKVFLNGINAATAAQATSLAGMRLFALANGATLAVSDSAAALLAGSNTAGLVKATSVTLSGINTVSAAQATTLATLPNFAPASGASLTVAGQRQQPAGKRIRDRCGRGHRGPAHRQQHCDGRPGHCPGEATRLHPGYRRNPGCRGQRQQPAAEHQCRRNRPGDQHTAVRQRHCYRRAGNRTGRVWRKFALTPGATLTVADRATELLASRNAAGIGLAASVTVTGLEHRHGGTGDRAGSTAQHHVWVPMRPWWLPTAPATSSTTAM